MMTLSLRQRPKAAALLTMLLVAVTSAAVQKPPAGAPAVKADVSGMYTFLQEGEFVQINVEAQSRQFTPGPDLRDRSSMKVETMPDGKSATVNAVYSPPTPAKSGEPMEKPRTVTGFVSRFGDLESDKGSFLDHFFTKGTLDGNELSFTTKTIHGVSFEFKGKIERGPAKAPAEEGYYVIRGTLKRIIVDAGTKKTSSQSREVVLKSFPDLDTDEGPSY
ncbi:MAG TPA: hypothetical protein VMZ25_04255 [Terriglobales bacterium]|nr:hypothetical protein [Terriglobales bacterium]